LSSSLSFGYSGGTGEPNAPYQIADANDLLALSANTGDYDKSFIMTADINLDPNLPGGQVFTTAVIAPNLYGIPAFSGVFDGAGHKIINLLGCRAEKYLSENDLIILSFQVILCKSYSKSQTTGYDVLWLSQKYLIFLLDFHTALYI
jgi:hypothetical protein